jgi:hypothetical protein
MNAGGRNARNLWQIGNTPLYDLQGGRNAKMVSGDSNFPFSCWKWASLCMDHRLTSNVSEGKVRKKYDIMWECAEANRREQ